jgi:hypothetical protein
MCGYKNLVFQKTLNMSPKHFNTKILYLPEEVKDITNHHSTSRRLCFKHVPFIANSGMAEAKSHATTDL